MLYYICIHFVYISGYGQLGRIGRGFDSGLGTDWFFHHTQQLAIQRGKHDMVENIYLEGLPI